MSTFGAGSSPVLSSTFLRTELMAPASFHSMPESSSAIATSGRPTLTSKAVFTGLLAAIQEPVSGGKVACASTRLMPVTPHSSSSWELFFVTATASVGSLGSAGVAANFHARPPTLVGVCPGASFQLEGWPGVPSPT